METKYYLRATQGNRQAYYRDAGGMSLFCSLGDLIEYNSAVAAQEQFDYFTSFAVRKYDDLPHEVKSFANRNDGPVEIEIVIVDPFMIKKFSFTTHSN